MKIAFDGLISRLDGTKERIIALDGRTVKTTQTEMQKEKRMKHKNVSKNIGTISKFVTSV